MFQIRAHATWVRFGHGRSAASCCADEILADLIILNHMGAMYGPMRTTTRAERGRVTPRRSPRARAWRMRMRTGRNRCAGIPGARGGVYIVAAAQPHGRRGRRATSAPLPTPHWALARCRVSRSPVLAPTRTRYDLTGTGDTSHRRDTAAGAVTPLTTSGDLAPELDLRWRYAIHTRTAESPKEIVRRPVHGRLACGAWAGGSA